MRNGTWSEPVLSPMPTNSPLDNRATGRPLASVHSFGQTIVASHAEHGPKLVRGDSYAWENNRWEDSGQSIP